MEEFITFEGVVDQFVVSAERLKERISGHGINAWKREGVIKLKLADVEVMFRRRLVDASVVDDDATFSTHKGDWDDDL